MNKYNYDNYSMNTEKTQEFSVALKALLDILLLFCFLSLKRHF